MKLAEYAEFMESKGRGTKPHDDGCTLVVNLFIDGWLINANVGDSRTVVGALLDKSSEFETPAKPTTFYEKYNSKKPIQLVKNEDEEESASSQSLPPTPDFTVSHQTAKMNLLFASSDHNMTHPRTTYYLQEHGGTFMLNTPPAPKFYRVDSPQARNWRPYSELIGTRVFRPKSGALIQAGVPHTRTLNLTSTMGDLLFKVAPAVMTSTPDVRFIKFDKGVDYVVFCGSDGVWDHLKEQTTQERQNLGVLEAIHDMLKETPEVSEVHLREICQEVIRRENQDPWILGRELYMKGFTRYDDASGQLLYFKAQ